MLQQYKEAQNEPKTVYHLAKSVLDSEVPKPTTHAPYTWKPKHRLVYIDKRRLRVLTYSARFVGIYINAKELNNGLTSARTRIILK